MRVSNLDWMTGALFAQQDNDNVKVWSILTRAIVKEFTLHDRNHDFFFNDDFVCQHVGSSVYVLEMKEEHSIWRVVFQQTIPYKSMVLRGSTLFIANNDANTIWMVGITASIKATRLPWICRRGKCKTTYCIF